MRLPTLSVQKTRISLRRHASAWLWSTSGRWWDSRADKWLRHAIVGVLGFFIVALLLSFWVPPTRTVSPTPVSQVTSGSHPAPTALADKIIAAHLFGHAINASAPNSAAQSITVDGIVYASEADGSEAVLTINGKTDVYKEGEALPDGEKVTTIGASFIQLTLNGMSRRLAIAQYGNPDSEGPAAYAALLRGTGLSAPVTQQAFAMLPGANPSTPPQVFAAFPTVTPANFVSVPSAQVVRIPATTTPLEQLRALRQQLIHHH